MTTLPPCLTEFSIEKFARIAYSKPPAFYEVITRQQCLLGGYYVVREWLSADSVRAMAELGHRFTILQETYEMPR